MLSCRVFGHSPRFENEGPTLEWECVRCGLKLGQKTYPTAADAERYARGLNVADKDDLGHRAPLGALPLRLWRALRRR